MFQHEQKMELGEGNSGTPGSFQARSSIDSGARTLYVISSSTVMSVEESFGELAQPNYKFLLCFQLSNMTEHMPFRGLDTAGIEVSICYMHMSHLHISEEPALAKPDFKRRP